MWNSIRPHGHCSSLVHQAGAGNLSIGLDFDPLDFFERKFLTGAIVQLGGSWRFVVSDGLGMFLPISSVVRGVTISRNGL